MYKTSSGAGGASCREQRAHPTLRSAQTVKTASARRKPFGHLRRRKRSRVGLNAGFVGLAAFGVAEERR